MTYGLVYSDTECLCLSDLTNDATRRRDLVLTDYLVRPLGLQAVDGKLVLSGIIFFVAFYSCVLRISPVEGDMRYKCQLSCEPRNIIWLEDCMSGPSLYAI